MPSAKGKMHPIVSVVMTVYNGETYLDQAINSVLAQSFRSFELIIVDDGSTDGTAAILATYQTVPQIRILAKGRIGRARALNEAWRAGTGIYIAILDADDLADMGRLQQQVAYLDEHRHIDVVGTACRVIYDDERPDWILNKPESDQMLRSRLVSHTPFVHSSVMMRRAALEQVGGYNEDMHVLIDSELWTRMARYGHLANLPEVLTIKRYSRSAFFRHQISRREKCKAKMRIRWFAWRHFSRKLSDLPYVLVEPPVRWVYSTIAG